MDNCSTHKFQIRLRQVGFVDIRGQGHSILSHFRGNVINACTTWRIGIVTIATSKQASDKQMLILCFPGSDKGVKRVVNIGFISCIHYGGERNGSRRADSTGDIIATIDHRDQQVTRCINIYECPAPDIGHTSAAIQVFQIPLMDRNSSIAAHIASITTTIDITSNLNLGISLQSCKQKELQEQQSDAVLR